MARFDPHSYHDADQPTVERIDWRAKIDFDVQVIEAEVTLHLNRSAGGSLDLDTRDLDVRSVRDVGGKPLAYTLFPAEPILGARLRVELPSGTPALRIEYRTSPSASALQWLTPEQTFGGQQPFLFSQCQAIHARSVIPVQDTPRVRITYRADLTVPARLRSVMAAGFLSRVDDGEWATDSFEMPQPIPPYLFALAVGDLGFRELGPRTGVWAEPAILDDAAWELADTEEMLRTAEGLFGPYAWEREDILVLPRSFPYGGMENPRLIFITPTILAGDRSLLAVIPHEIAHAWTGNLVTNATAEHFWINEGFTVFAERRLVEALWGLDVAVLDAALGRRGLDADVARFAARPELTHLRTHLDGVDPDDAYSRVPYEKGNLFLCALEAAVGRERFSAFLQQYINAFRFRSITTEELVDFIAAELPGALDAVDAAAWIYGPGLPTGVPTPQSPRLEAVEALGGGLPGREVAAAWSAVEWQLYLEALPRPLAVATCVDLDARFQLTSSRNYDILATWLERAIAAGYVPARSRVEEVLGEVGRMKYLRPLYQALATQPETRSLAEDLFSRYGSRYHPIGQAAVRRVLSEVAEETLPGSCG